MQQNKNKVITNKFLNYLINDHLDFLFSYSILKINIIDSNMHARKNGTS